jgi:hypothetical protein
LSHVYHPTHERAQKNKEILIQAPFFRLNLCAQWALMQ